MPSVSARVFRSLLRVKRKSVNVGVDVPDPSQCRQLKISLFNIAKKCTPLKTLLFYFEACCLPLVSKNLCILNDGREVRSFQSEFDTFSSGFTQRLSCD